MSTQKKLLVSSVIQAKLMNEFLINEIQNGFWVGQRPVTHGEAWAGVVAVVSDTNQVGPVNGFKPVRFYDFLNPTFTKIYESKLVEIAQSVKPNMTFKSLKKELIELARIIGGRMTDKTEEPARMYRGNNRADFDVLRSVDRQRVKIAAQEPRREDVKVVKEAIKTATRIENIDKPVAQTIRRLPANSVFNLGVALSDEIEINEVQ